MSWCCAIDGDPNAFYKKTEQKARIEHQCNFCQGTITPGTKYGSFRAGYDDIRQARGSRNSGVLFADVGEENARKWPNMVPYPINEDCFTVVVEKFHFECDRLIREAADMICGETTVCFGSTLDGASEQLLAIDVQDWGLPADDIKDWMEKYGEILEKHCA